MHYGSDPLAAIKHQRLYSASCGGDVEDEAGWDLLDDSSSSASTYQDQKVNTKYGAQAYALDDESAKTDWKTAKVKHVGGVPIPVCGDLEKVKINTIEMSQPGQPIVLNTVHGKCVPDDTVNVNAMLARNHQNFATKPTAHSIQQQTQQQQQQQHQTQSQASLSRPAVAGAVAGAATGALAGAAASRIAAPTITIPAIQPTPVAPAPPAPQYCVPANNTNSGGNCFLPWFLILVLAGLIIAALIAAVAGSCKAKHQGRDLDLCGTKKCKKPMILPCEPAPSRCPTITQHCDPVPACYQRPVLPKRCLSDQSMTMGRRMSNLGLNQDYDGSYQDSQSVFGGLNSAINRVENRVASAFSNTASSLF